MTTHALAVLGNPVAHSRSPEIHEQFAAQCGLTLTYDRILVPDGEFDRVASDFLERGIGFNVTVPCKVDAWRFVQTRGPEATEAEAVNTVSRDGNGMIRGDNTDGAGMLQDMTGNLGWTLAGRRVLLLGAGGAVRGVIPALMKASPALVHVHNRTEETASNLVARFNHPALRAVSALDLSSDYDVVINGTSAGLAGAAVNLPGRIVQAGTRCYDMIYGPGRTAFNRWCLEQADCEVSDGLGMLVEQAALSFNLWFDIKVKTVPVIESLRRAINEEAKR